VFLLLIASSPTIKAAGFDGTPATVLPACNSFPKIFGGSQAGSYLYQIDVFNDYLAMGGFTFDNTLTGLSSSRSYVALQSISVSGKIYWAKAF
jgi:hypothetical protein